MIGWRVVALPDATSTALVVCVHETLRFLRSDDPGTDMRAFLVDNESGALWDFAHPLMIAAAGLDAPHGDRAGASLQ